MTHAQKHSKRMNTSGSGCVLRRFGGKRIRSFGCRRSRITGLGQQLSQSHGPETDAALLEEPATRNEFRIVADVAMRLAVHRAGSHSFVIVSSRFNNTRATTVQAASCVGVAPFGNAGG